MTESGHPTSNQFAEFDPHAAPNSAIRGVGGLVVRRAFESDLEELARLAQERNNGEHEDWRAHFEHQRVLEEQSREAILRVASLGDRILGYGKANYFAPPETSPENVAPEGWYLTGVVVRPEFRRRGVGAALTLARLQQISQLANHAFYFANAQNRVSIELHRPFGFVEQTRDFWYPKVEFTGGVGVLYRCELAPL